MKITAKNDPEIKWISGHYGVVRKNGCVEVVKHQDFFDNSAEAIEAAQKMADNDMEDQA